MDTYLFLPVPFGPQPLIMFPVILRSPELYVCMTLVYIFSIFHLLSFFVFILCSQLIDLILRHAHLFPWLNFHASFIQGPYHLVCPITVYIAWLVVQEFYHKKSYYANIG